MKACQSILVTIISLEDGLLLVLSLCSQLTLGKKWRKEEEKSSKVEINNNNSKRNSCNVWSGVLTTSRGIFSSMTARRLNIEIREMEESRINRRKNRNYFLLCYTNMFDASLHISIKVWDILRIRHLTSPNIADLLRCQRSGHFDFFFFFYRSSPSADTNLNYLAWD